MDAGVISKETAQAIENYYQVKRSTSGNRLMVVFGIIGAILVGLGVILIIAHNWDHLSRSTKVGISFLPLVMGQIWCGYYLVKKPENNAWLESSSTFLILAIGASISLISQTYHIQGDMSAFLLTWSLLAAPLLFVMRSSMASLLLLILITWYSNESNYWTYKGETTYYYWLLLGLILYHMFTLIRKQPLGNFLRWHHWMVPVSVIISLASLASDFDEVILLSYMALHALFYLIGNLDHFNQQKTRNNSYLVLGSVGMVIILLITSFEDYWKHLHKQNYEWKYFLMSSEFLVTLILTILFIGMLVYLLKRKKLKDLRPLTTTYFLFFITYIIGFYSSIAVILINLMLLFFGLLTIRQGAKQDHLGILNYGLLIILALVLCRFFDSDLSFVLRGLLFVSVGIGFFLANFYLVKKRRLNEK